jgi:hypothetical protein
VSKISQSFKDAVKIAEGRGIREIDRLMRDFPNSTRAGWRKMKQNLLVESERTGKTFVKELHWYEHHGVGRVEFKIKRPE